MQRRKPRRIGVIAALVATASIFGVVLVQTPGSAAAPPPAGGYFNASPPGSAFPSETSCAAQVHHSPWEPRPENNIANHTAPNLGTLANFSQWTSAWNANYKPRITGNFQGTTDEIIQWAACKWGWSDDVIRAQAVQESSWRQSTVGDAGHSFGLLQIKYDFHPNVNGTKCKDCVGSSWPNSQNSTAYAVDQQVAEMRGCYDGMSTYLGNTTGDVWGCLQSWFDGGWTPGGGSYANSVKNHLANKAWRSWTDQSGSPTPTTNVPPSSASTTTKPKPPTTTTTKPKPPVEPNHVIYICLNGLGRVEPGRMGTTPQPCAHPFTDKVATVGYALLP